MKCLLNILIKTIRTTALLFFLFFLILIAALFLTPTGPGVWISVTNEGPSPISQIKLQYQKNEKTLSDCPPGHTIGTFWIPRGDSDVTIIYKDANQQLHQERINTYMEAGSAGTLTIWVNGPTGIHSKSNITSGPYHWF